MEKSQIYLNTPIGSGGEANIYEVRFRPDLVAKICYKPNADYARKLQIMITNPPDDLLAARGLVSIAWAVEPVTDLGQIVGFVMPRLDLSQVKPIFYYYNPSTRRKDFPWFNYERLLRTAQNLATSVFSVHSRGYAIALIPPQLKFLMVGEKQRVQELTTAGLRKYI